MGSAAAMATAVAYVSHPKWKAFIITLPVPFTFAVLSVGRPIGADHVLALVILFVFAKSVWMLHNVLRWPILAAVATAAVLYAATAAAMVSSVQRTAVAFWWSEAVVLSLAVMLLRFYPERREAEYRTPLPLWIKLPLTAALVGCLVALKQWLQGGMAFFPMVGVFAAYEARLSLWTMVRQIPVVMVLMVPTLAVAFVLQDRIGLVGALGAGWITFGALLFVMRKSIIPRQHQGDEQT